MFYQIHKRNRVYRLALLGCDIGYRRVVVTAGQTASRPTLVEPVSGRWPAIDPGSLASPRNSQTPK